MKTKEPLWIAAWAALLIAGIFLLRNTSITHDLSQFLPNGATDQQQLAVSLVRNGMTSRMILIGLGNATPDRLAATSQKMSSLMRESGFFSHVNNGTGLTTSGMDSLFRYRYLLDPSMSPTSFSEDSLRSSLKQRLAELTGTLPIFDQKLLQADPTGAIRSILGMWQADKKAHLYKGVWLTPDNREALIMAITHETGFDPEAQQATLSAIRSAFYKANAQGTVKLLISGAPVFSADTREAIRSNIQMLSIAASVLVAAFLLFAFRSIYLLFLAGIPIASGLIIATAVTSSLFGELHGITLVFGLTLLGVAIDYPIHLFSHLDPDTPPEISIMHIWPTLRLGVLTTCIGYLAFARHDFPGLAQLGIFTTIGLLTAAATSRWLLPSLLARNNRLHAPNNVIAPLDKALHLPRNTARIALLASIGVSALLYSTSPPSWEEDLAALSPLTETQRQTDIALRHAMGAPDASQLIVVTGTNADDVLSGSEGVTKRLDEATKLGLISGFNAPSLYLPSFAEQRDRQALIPDVETVRDNLDSAMRGLPFREDAFEPFLTALVESHKLEPLAFDDIENTSLGLRIQPMVIRDANKWIALVLLTGITSPTDFAHWWQNQDISNAQLINLKEASSEIVTTFRNSAIERLMAGILLIYLLISIGLRSPRKAVMVIVPVMLTIFLTTAMLGVLGEKISLFHIVALLLTAGIGIDYSLFFQRRQNERSGRQYITYALVICAASTLTVFGILATSSIPVLHAIGITVSLGAPLSFLLALASANATKPAIAEH